MSHWTRLWLPLSSFLVVWSPSVTREVLRSCLRRLIYPVQDHFIYLRLLIISMTFALSLTQMLVFLSLYVKMSIRLSILVCAAACLFRASLVSVQVCTICHRSARLLLKISRCLAYAAQPAMVLRFVVSLCHGFFIDAVVLSKYR